MPEHIMVITTTNDLKVAEKIRDMLLTNRLAGCIQIVGPIQSTYWWKGNIEHDTEYLILIKSVREHYKKIESAIKQIHNYTVPEILSFRVDQGNEDYLNWLKEETVIKNEGSS